jgi:hypothetical protein
VEAKASGFETRYYLHMLFFFWLASAGVTHFEMNI